MELKAKPQKARFWSKGQPSAAENYRPFEKQLLIRCWARVGIESLTMRHRGIVQLEMSIMSYVLLPP